MRQAKWYKMFDSNSNGFFPSELVYFGGRDLVRIWLLGFFCIEWPFRSNSEPFGSGPSHYNQSEGLILKHWLWSSREKKNQWSKRLLLETERRLWLECRPKCLLNPKSISVFSFYISWVWRKGRWNMIERWTECRCIFVVPSATLHLRIRKIRDSLEPKKTHTLY